jgi:hypothetical protein
MKAQPVPPSRFYFTGAAILPPIIAFADDLALAILVFVFLVLAGTVCAIAEPDAARRSPPSNRN